jgi:hypothetical protein
MKFLLLLVCQAALGFKLEPQGFDLKDIVVRTQDDKVFPFILTDYQPDEKFSLVIKSVHQEGNKEVHTIAADGTGDEINNQLNAMLLPHVVSHVENHKATVVIKSHTTGQEDKFEYHFRTVPYIQVEALHEKMEGPATYPLRSHKLHDAFKGKKLTLVPETNHPEIEMTNDDGHVVLSVKDGKAMPQLKFHVRDEETQRRSADLYTLPLTSAATNSTTATAAATGDAAVAAVAVPSKRRINPKTYAYVSGAFVILLLAAIVFYYSNKKKETNAYEPDRLTLVPGLDHANVPNRITLPADTYTQGNAYGASNNVLDLKDFNNK